MRKLLLAFVAVMSAVASLSACSNKNGKAADGTSDKKVLVAYFSATGTTENVAKLIADATKGELYKIKPKKDYSDADLDWTDQNSRSSRENANPASRPTIVKDKKSLDAYDVIYLGFPNWWNGAPRIINTFVETYELKGKKVIPFMTSGGSGIENSVKQLRKLYPDVKWQDGRLLNGATAKSVKKWVESL